MNDDARGRRASQRGHHAPLAAGGAPEATAAAGDSVMAFAPMSSSIEATLSAFNRSIAMRLMAPPQTQQSQQTTQSKKPKSKPLVRRIQEPPEEIPPPQVPTIPTSIRPSNSSKRRREEEDNAAAKVKADTNDDDKSVHVLMPNLGGAKLICRLCSKRWIKTRSRYGCTQCRLGFHVACFAVFHHPNEFTSNPSPAVQDALDALDKSASRSATRRRANNSINSFEQLTLPSLSDAQDALQDVEL